MLVLVEPVVFELLVRLILLLPLDALDGIVIAPVAVVGLVVGDGLGHPTLEVLDLVLQFQSALSVVRARLVLVVPDRVAYLVFHFCLMFLFQFAVLIQLGVEPV